MSDRLEGRRPVLEALRAGRDIRKILIATGMQPAPILRDLRRLAVQRKVPIEEVATRDLDRIARTRVHQGVVAVVAAFRYGDLGQLLRARRSEPLLLVALDGVTDPHNVGAIARSVEAAGGHGIVLPERRAAPVTPAVEKAAAGALAHLPVVRVSNLASAVERMKEAGVWIVSLGGGAATCVYDLPVADQPLCIVVGAEGAGVSRLVRDRSDLVVAIPLRGMVESLNASVAAGVALFEVARRRAAR